MQRFNEKWSRILHDSIIDLHIVGFSGKEKGATNKRNSLIISVPRTGIKPILNKIAKRQYGIGLQLLNPSLFWFEVTT